jgi:hypothetical protein
MSIEELLANRYWSAVEGSRAVELWRESGESVSAFAARTGLSAARLHYWTTKGSTGVENAEVVLAPVAVLTSRESTGSAISIELRSGRVIRIEGNVDDGLLARVIEIAERVGC